MSEPEYYSQEEVSDDECPRRAPSNSAAANTVVVLPKNEGPNYSNHAIQLQRLGFAERHDVELSFADAPEVEEWREEADLISFGTFWVENTTLRAVTLDIIAAYIKDVLDHTPNFIRSNEDSKEECEFQIYTRKQDGDECRVSRTSYKGPADPEVIRSVKESSNEDYESEEAGQSSQ